MTGRLTAYQRRLRRAARLYATALFQYRTATDAFREDQARAVERAEADLERAGRAFGQHAGRVDAAYRGPIHWPALPRKRKPA